MFLVIQLGILSRAIAGKIVHYILSYFSVHGNPMLVLFVSAMESPILLSSVCL